MTAEASAIRGVSFSPASSTPNVTATIGLTKANLGSAWQIYSESRYGIRRFELELPPSAARDRRFGIELRLISWRWRLVSVRLPEQLRIQLAQMLIKREAKR